MGTFHPNATTSFGVLAAPTAQSWGRSQARAAKHIGLPIYTSRLCRTFDLLPLPGTPLVRFLRL